MDAILCCLQSLIEKVASMRFRTLPVWVGVGWLAGSQFGCMGTRKKLTIGDTTVAKVIEFYVPDSFRKKELLTPGECRGRVIEFKSRHSDGAGLAGREELDQVLPQTHSAAVDRSRL